MDTRTITLPVQALTPDTTKALSVTGRIVTVTEFDGHKYQGKVKFVEGTTWTTSTNEDGDVRLDYSGTPLTGYETPWAYIAYTNPWDETVHQWMQLSSVTRGVCLAKY